jgi:Domain of unknown function (DUF4421)
MKFLSGLIFLCHLPLISFAQTGTDSTRNPYIKSYKDKFFLWPVLKQRSLTFELQNPDQSGNTVKFRPNNAFGLGLGMYVFDLGFELVFAVPLNQEKESNFGRTSAQDIQLNILSRSWGGDIYYQNYRGFYLSDPDSPIPASGAYPQRADFRTENFGISGTYAFNHEKFSLRSSFTFADRQLKSAGSFLLVGTYNSFRLSADSAILNNHYSTRLGLTNSVKSLNYQTASIAPGYSYNLVYKNLYLSGLFAIGPAVQWLSYDNDVGENQSVTKVNTFVSLRVAAGYSNDRFFTGITFVSQARNVQFENIQFSNTSATYRILFGWRFQEFGFLKKSVWDLLPPWGKKK